MKLKAFPQGQKIRPLFYLCKN